MQWLHHPPGFRLVAAPQLGLSVADAKAFLGMRAKETEPDAQLAQFCAGVVGETEYRIRGAVFPQVRLYTARFGSSEMPRREFSFEPFRDSPSPVVLLNGAARPFTSIAGQIIRLDEMLDPDDGDVISFQLSVGFDPLPASLKQEMLIEVQRKLERFRQIETDGQAPVLIPRGSGALQYRSANEPLDPGGVEVGDGLA